MLRDPLDPKILLHGLRVKALTVVVAVGLAAFALLSWLTLPAWPVIGVAVVTVAAMVHRLASGLTETTCRACGADVSREPIGQYGVICHACGAINELDQASIDPATAAGLDADTGDALAAGPDDDAISTAGPLDGGPLRSA